MDEHRRIHFRVGVLVIATLLMTALLIARIADQSLFTFKDKYKINVVLPQAPGVAQGTPVRKNGVLIGRVEQVDLTDDGVVVVLKIDDDRKIRKSEICRVSSSILGDAILEFVPGQKLGKEIIQPNDTIVGTVRANPLDIFANIQGDLSETITSLGSAGHEVSILANKVNRIIDDADVEKLDKLFDNTEQAMAAFTRTMNTLESIVGDPEIQNELRQGIKDFPKLITEARETMKRVQGTVEAAERNLKNLEGLTGPIGERGDQIVSNLESASSNLNQLLGQVAVLTKSFNNSEGTIGQLFRSRKLYDDVDKVVQEIHILTRKLRPIMDDVRVVTDKAARNPGVFIRGAIKKPGLPFK